jgi:hypothetical protein
LRIGRLGRRDERCGETQGEAKSALREGRAETSKDYQGKIKTRTRKTGVCGTQIRLGSFVCSTRRSNM